MVQLFFMGYPNNQHIKTFAKGQTIADIAEDDNGSITLLFASGESLLLWPRIKRQPTAELETIAMPIKADGVIKQTTEISRTEPLSHGGSRWLQWRC